MSQMSQIRSLYRSLFRLSANIYVSKLPFAVVWLGHIQNLDTGHVYVLGLKSGSERLCESLCSIIEEPVPLSGSFLSVDGLSRIFGGVVELHGDTSCWELAHDSSIECNSDQQAFELVSPKLTLDSMGLTKVHAVLSRSKSVLPGLCVNVDAGFHVHVDISDVGLDEIKSICAQFVEFEDVMDRFMPQ